MNKETIYAIEHPHGFVKIGRATDVRERLANIRIGSPFDLKLVLSFETAEGGSLERHLHETLSDSHQRGEWFDVSPDTVRELFTEIVEDDEWHTFLYPDETVHHPTPDSTKVESEPS